MAIRKFTRRIFEGKEIDIYGDGSSRRDYTFIDDIVSGVLGALNAPPGYLGESSTISLADLVSLLEKACGRPALRRFAPPQPGDVPLTFADVSRAKAEIGYDPHTPIEEGIVRFVEWFRRQ